MNGLLVNGQAPVRAPDEFVPAKPENRSHDGTDEHSQNHFMFLRNAVMR